MGVKLESLFGNAAIGPYLSINNEFLLVPKITPEEKFDSIKSAFPDDFSIYRAMCNQSALLGSYIVMNSSGILVPTLILDEEIEQLKMATKDRDMKISVIESRDNALGNLILCNNKGAIISKSLSKNISTIQDILDVEVTILEFAGNKLPGSSGIANNFGCCVHPLVTDDEAELISDILKVPIDVCTINMGNPYMRSGAVVNDSGAIFGSHSSGSELMRLSMMLKL